MPSNLSSGRNPSLDYGFTGAEIAMVLTVLRFTFLLIQLLATRKADNRDVTSLGLISLRKTQVALHILKLMSSTFLSAPCRAIDLRHLEENLKHNTLRPIPQQLLSSF
ncbi:hypothetical protein JCGZ_13139 [Jatropha curcas]|uniref:phenylalanine ammonia-lyase n=1 Tax=Jatropha curcas TaxID=180498 RepID=A0A067KLA5_JATCU|nr:hypothetical protein JCGZ_13139 [Jatropha curcas]